MQGHSAVTNSLALQLAEITLNTPQPEGGVIEVGEDGQLNGVIRERQSIVGRLVPDSTYEEIIASLEVNLNALLAKGITSITDASKTVDDYEMFEDLYQNNALALPRSALQFQWYDPDAINALNARVGEGNDSLKPGPIKVFADGGFTGPAAYTLEPYVNQGEYRVISTCRKANWLPTSMKFMMPATRWASTPLAMRHRTGGQYAGRCSGT